MFGRFGEHLVGNPTPIPTASRHVTEAICPLDEELTSSGQHPRLSYRLFDTFTSLPRLSARIVLITPSAP